MQRQRLEFCLRQLELDSLPDASGLKAQFYRLLKEYHPDRNRSGESAEEKTKEILESFHFVKEYIEKQARPETVRVSYVKNPAAKAEPAKPEERMEFQLLRSEDEAFALPIRRLRTILMFNPFQVKRNLAREYYEHETVMYPALSLDGNSLCLQSTAFIALLDGQSFPVALGINNRMRFVSIEGFTGNEVTRVLATENRYLQWDGDNYLYPGELIAELSGVASNAASVL